MDENALMNIVSHEKNIMFFYIIGVFVVMGIWEWLASRRSQKITRQTRWPNNLGLVLLNILIFRVIFPGTALAAGYWAFVHQFGLFHWCPVPLLFSIVFTVIALDYMSYYLHRLYHNVPWLWKIHRTHHTDPEVDITTGGRFHTLEILITLLFKWATIALLGAPVYGIFLFEIILNVGSIFSHSNVRIPQLLDHSLRLLIVTPDMHRIHHSVIPTETNSNFGFILTWWDRLLGTYRAEPQKGQEGMELGLGIFNGREELQVDRLLLQPFLDKEGRFALNNIFKKAL
jgi:sterol desaturase/sphingolipid hydroxylase (fatty acid hydroxylase superfamily)